MTQKWLLPFSALYNLASCVLLQIVLACLEMRTRRIARTPISSRPSFPPFRFRNGADFQKKGVAPLRENDSNFEIEMSLKWVSCQPFLPSRTLVSLNKYPLPQTLRGLEIWRSKFSVRDKVKIFWSKEALVFQFLEEQRVGDC